MIKLEQIMFGLLVLLCILTFLFGIWVEYLKVAALYKYVFG